MTVEEDRRLVFRLGDVGFSLLVSALVEILDSDEQVVEPAEDPHAPCLRGRLCRRGEELDVYDLGKLFLNAPSCTNFPALLVVQGTDRRWGFGVDALEGIHDRQCFSACPVPLALSQGCVLPYDELDLWRSEPLVRFDPRAVENFWGRS